MSSRRGLLMLENTLPLDYTLRTTVSFNGVCYFNAEYCVHSTDKIECGVRLPVVLQNGIFGVESSTGSSFYFLGQSKDALVGHGLLTATCQDCLTTDISEYTFNKSGLSVGGSVLVSPFSTAVFKSDAPLFIGAINKDGTPYALAKGAIYYFKIYNAKGELLRNFVPCSRKSDGEQGLYELVYQRFHPKLFV